MLLPSHEAEERKRYFTALYRKYFPLMKYAAHGILHDYDAADDVIQDALVSLIEHYEKLRTLSGPQATTYIYVTVRGTAVDFQRRRQRKPVEPLEEADGASESPESEYLRSETRQEVAAAVDALPDDKRDLLRSKYGLDQTDEELAAKYHVNRVAIRKRLSRAQLKLRGLLGGKME